MIRYSFGVVLWEAALLRKPYIDVAAQVGAAGALFCTIMENYREGIGLPMDEWPAAAETSPDEATECTNQAAGAVGLIGEDLRQLVEQCLRLKHTKQKPRPTFETVASALATMLQKLRHRANMERRQAERNSNQVHTGAGQTRIAPAGSAGESLATRREISSDSNSGDSPTGLLTSPTASQRGGLMAPLSPIAQERPHTDSEHPTSDVASLPEAQAQNPTARPSLGGRRVVHMLRSASGKLSGRNACFWLHYCTNHH